VAVAVVPETPLYLVVVDQAAFLHPVAELIDFGTQTVPLFRRAYQTSVQVVMKAFPSHSLAEMPLFVLQD
jgi:hypothetical protein